MALAGMARRTLTSRNIDRREFFSKVWMWGLGLIGLAGVWTSWDVLRPKPQVGFGGEVNTLLEADVPTDSVATVRAVRGYVTSVEGEVVALFEKCPHLGCRVAWCEQSGEFECACHGSAFNRLGEVRKGPSPRGMDQFPTRIVDGVVVVDSGTVIEGNPPGSETLNEPARGPSCAEEEA